VSLVSRVFIASVGGQSRSVEPIGHEVPQSSTNISPELGLLFGTICDTDSLHFVMFGRSSQTVYRALSDHGIPKDGLSYDLCRQALCHHLLNGLCARQQGQTCGLVAGSCTVNELVRTISLQFLELCQRPEFSLSLFREICAGLGIRSHGDGERQALLVVCEAWCAVLATCPDTTLHSALFHLEMFSKSEALACAASHGLTCSGTVASVKMAVYEHVFEGACTAAEPDFSACHAVQDSLSLPRGASVDDFQIRLLSVVVPCAPRCFLTRLLESKKLPYKATMNVSSAKDPSSVCKPAN
jgi:hypothetical protein